MGELQIGLLAVGTLVVAGVFFYNKWQERRYRREAEAAFGSRHEDVLMRSRGGDEAASRDAPERVEPQLGPSDAPAELAGRPRPVLAESIDFIVPLETAEEVSGAAILDTAGPALDRCPRSVHLEGFDEALGAWELVNPERRYSRLRAGLQLADRRGAANADDLAQFGAAIEDAGAALGVLATVPAPAEALARAAELDRFCSEVDIRIAVHVMNENRPFPGARVEAVAKAAGFELDEPDGKFRCRDEAGRVICALANFEPIPFKVDSLETLSTQAVTLEIDVPRTPRGAFTRFREAAERFARQLNGRIVDDNRQPVGPGAFEAIAAQLGAVHAAMEARGIAPGGPVALRLFS